MSVGVNVVSEVRQFTTLSGRTVYVLDGESGFDLDALIAACNSKSCAPPPVGTGGSISTAVQHITSRESAALIKKGGFLVGRGEMHGSLFGNGIYLSMAGDKMATRLYKKGTEYEGHAPALVRGTVRLKRSLKVSGDTQDEVYDDIVRELGGKKAVQEAARSSYDRLRDGAKSALKKVLGDSAVAKVDWNGEFETDPVFNDMASVQYADFVAAVNPFLPHGMASFGDLRDIKSLRNAAEGNLVKFPTKNLANLVADLGYDGIEITNPSSTPAVGGSQIVVFDPKTITVESVEDFGALIERFGIEVTLDYVPSTVVCAEHGEFACNSKACAPPPVGRGGSLPSVNGTPVHGTKWEQGSARLVGSMSRSLSVKEMQGLDDLEMVYEAQVQWGKDQTRINAKVRSNLLIRERVLEDPKFIKGVGKLIDMPSSELIRINTDSMDAMYHPAIATINMLSRIAGIGHVFPMRQQLKEIADALPLRTKSDPSLRDFIDAIQRQMPDEFMEDGSSRIGDLTPEQFASSAVVAAMIDSWANTSMGTPLAIAHQLAAADLHGLNADKFVSEYRDLGTKGPLSGFDIKDGRAFFEQHRELLVSMARAEYEVTQEFLSRAGIKEVTVYRGVKFVDPIESDGKEVEIGDTIRSGSNALSSWSIDFDMGKEFAEDMGVKFGFKGKERTHGYVMGMKVPASMVQALPTSGRGCLEEFEVILIGHPSEVGIVEYIPKVDTVAASGAFVAVH